MTGQGTTRAVTMLLIALGATGAHGQAQALPADSLSLQEAIRLAVEREPGLRGERTEAEVSQGNLLQAGLKPNPTISVGRQQQPGGMDHQTSVTVEWPLDLFRPAGRIAVAAREADAVRFRVADRERLLTAEVRSAYGAVAAATRERDVLRELAETAERQLEVIRSRVDAGGAPPLDRDLFVVERRRIDADRLLQDARVQNARVALQRLLGLNPADQITLRDTLESLVDPHGAPPPIANGRPEARPDVRAAEADLRVADAALDRARRDGRFDLSLFGTYTRMQFGFPQLGFGPNGNLQPVEDTSNLLAAGATLTIPWRNDNRGEVAASTARRLGADARRAAAELLARTEISAASTLDQQARAAVSLYAEEIRPLARRNIEVVRHTYQMGRGTVADVLAEQRRSLEIERAYTDALKQAYDARTSLLSALGVQP